MADRLMPIDLERHELKLKFRGYDPQQADRLLSSAAKSLQEALFENSALRTETDRLRSELEFLIRQEQTLKDVLIAAQRSADETRMAAQRQAHVMIEEARQASSAERMGAQQKLSEVRWEIERLLAERNRYAEEFKALLERHQRELGQIIEETRVSVEKPSE